MANRATYLTTRNGHYYFKRKLTSGMIRLSLRTSNVNTASHRAATLFIYTNQLRRLGFQHREMLRLTKVRAEQIHEEALTAAAFRQPVAQLATQPLAQLPATPHVTPSIQPPVPRPLLLLASLEDALRDLCRSGGKEHHRKYREAFNELSLLNPSAHFHDFRFAEASLHLQNLMRLPRRRTDRKPYKNMAIADVLELDTPPDQLLSATSINERMKRLARLFDWAAENEAYSGSNPFRSQTLKLTEKPRERSRYTPEDLNILLSSALFTDSEYRSGPGGSKSWWWLIMLALYTGARVGELAQWLQIAPNLVHHNLIALRLTVIPHSA
ncbi:MAG: hypothetical protein ACJAWF_001176 [Candidatus Azotimanducaceae bacterium]|jgi:hypothetical protein